MLAKIKTILILILMGGIAYLLFQGSTFLDSKLENKPSQRVQDEPVSVAPANESNEEIQSEIAKVRAENDKAIEAEATQERQAGIKKVPITVDSTEDEISNSTYSWLQHQTKCYPTAKADLKEAFDNDGVIRENERTAILLNCNARNENQASGSKAELRNMVQ